MPRNITVAFKDGTSHTYENAPDDVTPEQVQSRAEKQFAKTVTGIDGGRGQSPDASRETPESVNDNSGILKNIGMGALKGATDIGATLLRPVDAALNAAGLTDTTNQQRRASLGQFFGENADPNSLAFKGGEIASSIAGTAGAGGVLGKGLAAVSKTPKALQLAEALRTGGMAAGAPLATNIVGGAGSSAAGTLLLNPSDTGTSAAIGAALPVVGKASSAVGGAIGDLVGSLGTHTGGDSLRTAARVGAEGGKAAKDFTDNMRGKVPMTDVLETAKTNLQKMAMDKAAEYRAGMAQVSGDKTVLGFGGIDKAVQDAGLIANFKGKATNAKAAEVQAEIADEIAKWKALDPAEYHTPEGLDALKKKIGGIVESIPFEQKTARKAAGEVYRSIKQEIQKQAPTYAKTMKGYEEASTQITEIERALSLGDRASADTAMRKLQSLTRNNANTNYGNRTDLARQLETQGGAEIMPALSGQALNSFAPRGLGKAIAGATGVGGLATMNPVAIPALALQSPRLMGEAAYATGKATSSFKKLYPGRATAGILDQVTSD
jgi:hypothetical protein